MSFHKLYEFVPRSHVRNTWLDPLFMNIKDVFSWFVIKLFVHKFSVTWDVKYSHSVQVTDKIGDALDAGVDANAY